MEAVMKHPELQGLRQWILLTFTADWLYEKYGFNKLPKTEIYMELFNPNIYKNWQLKSETNNEPLTSVRQYRNWRAYLKDLCEVQQYSECSIGDTIEPLANLYFDSIKDIKKAFATEVGQQCALDRKILAPSNDDVQIYWLSSKQQLTVR